MEQRDSFGGILALFLGIGAVLALVGTWLQWRQYVVDGWPQTQVEVLASEASENEYGRFVPVVSVRLPDARVVVLQTGLEAQTFAEAAETLAAFEVGARVLVPANPDEQSDLRLPVEGPNRWLGLMLVGGGLLFVLVPLGIIAIANRRDAFAWAGRILAACGVVLAVVAGGMVRHKLHVLETWPEASATILDSRISPRPGQMNHRAWGIDARVRFVVGNAPVETLVGSRGGTTDARRLQARLEQDFAPGTTLRLRYDADRPAVATFEASRSLSYFWEAGAMALGGLAMLGLGLAISRVFRPKPWEGGGPARTSARHD